jgi:hypothetical protein
LIRRILVNFQSYEDAPKKGIILEINKKLNYIQFKEENNQTHGLSLDKYIDYRTKNQIIPSENRVTNSSIKGKIRYNYFLKNNFYL